MRLQRIFNPISIYTIPAIPRCTTAKFSPFPRVKRRLIPSDPISDVYFTPVYTPQPKNLSIIISALRAYSLTEKDEDIFVSLNINMLDKKSRPIQPIKGIIAFPHTFGEKSKIFVFCNDTELEQAKLSRADKFLIKKNFNDIESMELDHDIYIATEGVIQTIMNYQNILRANMPSSRKGSVVSLDQLPRAVEDFLFKRNYSSLKTGYLEMLIGKISFTEEMILQNFKCLINELEQHKSNAKEFIISVRVYKSNGPDFMLKQDYFNYINKKVEDTWDFLKPNW